MAKSLKCTNSIGTSVTNYVLIRYSLGVPYIVIMTAKVSYRIFPKTVGLC